MSSASAGAHHPIIFGMTKMYCFHGSPGNFKSLSGVRGKRKEVKVNSNDSWPELIHGGSGIEGVEGHYICTVASLQPPWPCEDDAGTGAHCSQHKTRDSLMDATWNRENNGTLQKKTLFIGLALVLERLIQTHCKRTLRLKLDHRARSHHRSIAPHNKRAMVLS